MGIEKLNAMIPDILSGLVKLQYDVKAHPDKPSIVWSGNGATCVSPYVYLGETGFIVYASLDERPAGDDFQGRAFNFGYTDWSVADVVSILASALEKMANLGWKVPKIRYPLSQAPWVIGESATVLFEDETVGVVREDEGLCVYVWNEERWEEIDQLPDSAGDDEPGGNIVHIGAYWREVAYRTLQAHTRRSARALRQLSRLVPRWDAALAAWVAG